MGNKKSLASLKSFPFQFIVIFLIFAAVTGAAGYRYYHYAKEHLKNESQKDLSVIADLKIDEITKWRKERLGDANLVFRNPFMTSAIHQWLKHGSPDLKQKIVVFMKALDDQSQYRRIILLDEKGDIRLTVPADEISLGPNAKKLASEALLSKKIIFSDLYISKLSDTVRLTLVVPLLVQQRNETVPVGVLLLRVDPSQFLYPLIQSWPTPSDSAETLLIRREGDDVVFLNELRHKKNTALKLRFKITEETLPAAMALRGTTGIVEGLDYRGVPVLAALRAIPGSTWSLVSKVDKEEIYRPLVERSWFLVLLVILLVTVTGLGLLFVWHRRGLEIVREERDKAQQYLDIAAVMFLIINADQKVVLINRKGSEILGYKEEEIIGMDWFDKFVPEKIREEVKGAFSKLTSGEVSPGGYFENMVLTRNGEERLIAWHNTVIRDESDNIIGTLSSGDDITQRKQTEESLIKTMLELERSNKELEQFAYIASHDLQEPLRMVSSYVQLLAQRYKGRFDADADDFIHYAVDGASRMQTMINDLLAYSRVGTKGKPFGQADCDEILKQVLAGLKLQIAESGALITSDPLPVVMADASQLHQVFQNLISNAIKFRGEKTPEIYIRAERKESEWVFSVSDNGIGFEQKYAGKIFDIFKRLHSASKYPGSGIGLTICRKIIERHKGRVWAESGPGKGSVFYFTLPARHEE